MWPGSGECKSDAGDSAQPPLLLASACGTTGMCLDRGRYSARIAASWQGNSSPSTLPKCPSFGAWPRKSTPVESHVCSFAVTCRSRSSHRFPVGRDWGESPQLTSPPFVLQPVHGGITSIPRSSSATLLKAGGFPRDRTSSCELPGRLRLGRGLSCRPAIYGGLADGTCINRSGDQPDHVRRDLRGRLIRSRPATSRSRIRSFHPRGRCTASYAGNHAPFRGNPGGNCEHTVSSSATGHAARLVPGDYRTRRCGRGCLCRRTRCARSHSRPPAFRRTRT